jgi:hypothetical protein
VLILIDDVDLLERNQPQQQEARRERTRLADALCELQAQPGVDVVLTARSWYHNSSREFETLVDLGRSEMPSEDLCAIYDLHMKTYAKKAGLECFLKREALQQFSEQMADRPGVFLQHLQTAFYDYQSEEDFYERDYQWFVEVFRRLYSRYRASARLAAEMLEEAVKAGRLELEIKERNPFYATVFDNLFVFQSHYNEQCYFATPLLREILKPGGVVSRPIQETSRQ